MEYEMIYESTFLDNGMQKPEIVFQRYSITPNKFHHISFILVLHNEEFYIFFFVVSTQIINNQIQCLV